MHAPIDYFDKILRTQKGYVRAMEPVCKQWNLTQNEMNILVFLYNNPKLDRAADIVNCRGIAKSHVSLAVSNLQARGLLRRRLDTADRRTVHLELAESGRPISEEGMETQRRFFVRVFAGLTPEELALNRMVADKISLNIEKMEENP